MHGKFHEDNLQTLVDNAGPNFITPLKDISREHNKEDKPPTLKSKVVALCKIKEPPHKEVQKKNTPALAHQINRGSLPLGFTVSTSNKRSSQNDSGSSHGDQNFNRVKPYLTNKETLIWL